jgi:hypothetical protein
MRFVSTTCVRRSRTRTRRNAVASSPAPLCTAVSPPGLMSQPSPTR